MALPQKQKSRRAKLRPIIRLDRDLEKNRCFSYNPFSLQNLDLCFSNTMACSNILPQLTTSFRDIVQIPFCPDTLS